ncbi:MAG: carboxypeptidase M32 [Vicinamibacterales bacterium]
MSDELLQQLTTLTADVIDLRRASALLEWDEQVHMPPGGAAVHAEMVATIRKVAHEKFTADEVGRLLERLQPAIDDGAIDPDAARLVRLTAREFDKATRVPSSFVAELAQVESAAQHAWADARARSDFAAFRPHLERIVELKRRYVSFFPPAVHPYDILLDDFEPGTTTAEVKAVFDQLRPRQVALVAALRERPQVDDAFLRAAYPQGPLWDFGAEVVSKMGFDWTRGRQDRSVHPFATAIGPDDVRITTRFVEAQPLAVLFGTMHEAGHALYEQGLTLARGRTLVGEAVSLGFHESQSRLWENMVGRSRAFWEHFYPQLQGRVPGQLADVPLERFYRGINKVQPSLVRVEADEATYNLHVMLRVELELGLIEGTLAVADLPELWRVRMREYLGIVPETDAEGVLQDIHWAIGAIGYFATYTLGNLISAQLWDRFGEQQPDRDAQIARGEFAPLLDWLREHVHRHGRRFEPRALLERIVGRGVDPDPYLRYLEQKYGEIYGLS